MKLPRKRLDINKFLSKKEIYDPLKYVKKAGLLDVQNNKNISQDYLKMSGKNQEEDFKARANSMFAKYTGKNEVKDDGFSKLTNNYSNHNMPESFTETQFGAKPEVKAIPDFKPLPDFKPIPDFENNAYLQSRINKPAKNNFDYSGMPDFSASVINKTSSAYVKDNSNFNVGFNSAALGQQNIVGGNNKEDGKLNFNYNLGDPTFNVSYGNNKGFDLYTPNYADEQKPKDPKQNFYPDFF